VARALRDEGVAAEIISADSRQVYRGLDIGTAKATPEERALVPHHGLDLVDPDEPFSVAAFVRHTQVALDAIAARHGLAILVGGTGLWLRAVARALDVDALPSDPAVRARIEADLARDGPAVLVGRLRERAPRLAATTDLRNPRRVARALEIAEVAGDVPRPEARGYPGPVAWLGLEVEAPTHRDWIRRRAGAQFEAGLVEEARGLRARFDPHLPAFTAIGYAEAWAVIDGLLTVDEAIERDAQRNVAFARRQRTWFRSEPDIRWLRTGAGEGSPLPKAVTTARDLVGSAPTAASGSSQDPGVSSLGDAT
jgi:tRNA dimethylallyltransferase